MAPHRGGRNGPSSAPKYQIALRDIQEHLDAINRYVRNIVYIRRAFTG